METVAETMVSLVVTLAAASYGHFGVTLKPAPQLQHSHVQRHQQTVQRLPASTMRRYAPCPDTIAERAVTIRRA